MTTTDTFAVPASSCRDLASAISYSFFRVEGADRPIDRKKAYSEFEGFLKAFVALGLARTPFAVEMDIKSVLRRLGPRPGFRPAGNSAQQSYDQDFVTAVYEHYFVLNFAQRETEAL